MKKSNLLVVAIAFLIGLGLVAFFLRNTLDRPLSPEITAPEPATDKAPEAPLRHPVPEPPLQAQVPPPEPLPDAEKPLPPLNESDEEMREVVAGFFSTEQAERWFVFNHFIQRCVILVDNLPRKQLPLNHLPTKPAPGTFLAAGEEGDFTFDKQNYSRYTPFVRLVETVDARKAVSFYIRLYPLFQSAYRELGYPTGNFNRRLLEVLDHLLAAPDIRDPVKLVRPVLRYRFVDPELEALSAGQKIMIRIGYDNALRIKAKLREIRREIANRVWDN